MMRSSVAGRIPGSSPATRFLSRARTAGAAKWRPMSRSKSRARRGGRAYNLAGNSRALSAPPRKAWRTCERASPARGAPAGESPTTAATRSGWVAAACKDSAPPKEFPMRTAGSESHSSTAPTAASCSRTVAGSSPGASRLRPWPGKSSTSTRRATGRSGAASPAKELALPPSPWTRTTGGAGPFPARS